MSIVSHQGVFLVLGHGIITCSKQVLGDLSITEWFLVSSGWRVSLNTNNTSGSALFVACGCIHLIHHHLLVILLLSVVLLLILSRNSEIHQSLHGLFALWSLGFQLVQRIIKDLSAIGEELTQVLQVNLNDVVFGKEFTDHHEHVCEHGCEY